MKQTISKITKGISHVFQGVVVQAKYAQKQAGRKSKGCAGIRPTGSGA
jgi:hypothetical protein